MIHAIKIGLYFINHFTFLAICCCWYLIRTLMTVFEQIFYFPTLDAATHKFLVIWYNISIIPFDPILFDGTFIVSTFIRWKPIWYIDVIIPWLLGKIRTLPFCHIILTMICVSTSTMHHTIIYYFIQLWLICLV